MASAMMVKAWTLSARYDPDLHADTRRLPGVQPGWFMGRHNDLSDHQWRVFRDNLPKLAMVAAITVNISRPSLGVSERCVSSAST